MFSIKTQVSDIKARASEGTYFWLFSHISILNKKKTIDKDLKSSRKTVLVMLEYFSTFRYK